MSTADTEVTRRLAEWVCESDFSSVPDAVRGEAARTLLNWMGCAPWGDRRTNPWTSRCGHWAPSWDSRRPRCWAGPSGSDVLHASLLNGLSSHVFDFDDTHLQDHHPSGRAGGVGPGAAGRAPSRLRPGLPPRADPRGRGGVPHRQRRLPGPLRRGLAHHRHRRGVRRRGRRRPPAGTGRSAHVLGAGRSRHPGRRAAGDVRDHAEAVPHRTGGAERPRRRAAGRRGADRLRARHRGAARLRPGAVDETGLRRHLRRPRATATRPCSTPTSPTLAAS